MKCRHKWQLEEIRDMKHSRTELVTPVCLKCSMLRSVYNSEGAKRYLHHYMVKNSNTGWEITRKCRIRK